MTYRKMAFGLLFALPVLTLVGLWGCGIGSPALPSEVTVELPDGTSVKVDEDSGAQSLANTSWRFYRTASNAQAAPFVTIAFGETGNLERFDNNTIASEVFGDTIVFDGQRHPTNQSGVEYAASTYGAETSDATGFTFEGRMVAYAAGLQAGNATASAVGELDDLDPTIMRGTFSFSTRVTLIDMPEANVDDEFTFLAQKILDEEVEE